MVAVTDFPAGRAGKDLSTQRFRAAALNRAHGAVVAGQETRGVFLAVGWSVLAEDVCQF